MKSEPKEDFDVTMHIRAGYKYYSIFLNEQGGGFAKKGRGTYYKTPFQCDTVIDNAMFKIDSISMFLENLKKLKEKPLISGVRPGGSRAEIYFKHRKICDTYHWDTSFWKLVRPIMFQIPEKLNPFIPDNW